MTRKQLLKELKNLGISNVNIDDTPMTVDGTTAIRLANNTGQETYFTASDVYDGGEWTEANEQREAWLKEMFS